MSEEASLQTPREGQEQLDPAGLQLVEVQSPPRGAPEVLGPAVSGALVTEVNPFWSEGVREDLAIRAMRPAALPPLDDGAVPAVSGTGGGSTDLLAVLDRQVQQQVTPAIVASGNDSGNSGVVRQLVDDNVRLRAEIEGLKNLVMRSGFGQGSNQNSLPSVLPVANNPVQQQVLGPQSQPGLGNLGTQVAASSTVTGAVASEVQPSAPLIALGLGQVSQVPQGVVQGSGLQGSYGNALHNPPPAQGHGCPGGGNGGNGVQGFGGLCGNPGLHQGGGPGCGGTIPGIGGFGNEAPAWLATLLTQQESIRSVDLPALGELGESEAGPLMAGDWLAAITPLMKDISQSSAQWWNTVPNVAGTLYQSWLAADPMGRLRIHPTNPVEFDRPPFVRVEQRAQAILLKALPESLRSEIISSRMLGSTQIIFRVLTRYQPGGLDERTTLLKQLVEVKAPSNVAGVTNGLRSWKRWLVRVGELGINPPDPTLLMSALDKMAGVLTKGSTQTGFRLSSARAQLQVDTCPSLASVMSFADTLLAEAESMLHGGSSLPFDPNVKVKAIDGGGKQPDGKGQGKGSGKDETGGSQSKVCRYFTSDGGCKKGKACSFLHEWGSVNKYGRCWNCGSSQHRREDCTVKDGPSKTQAKKQRTSGASEKKEDQAAKTEEATGSSSTKEGVSTSAPENSGTQDANVAGLLAEATHLHRSMRPSVKSVKLSSLEVGLTGRALLDGGATHALRTAVSKEEYNSAIPIKVELAAGEAVLRQIPETGLLLTEGPTQTIVPLGKVMLLGYSVTCSGWKRCSY